ncbi:MAG: DUF4173 domain-containing protein, partial [Anaerolineae bacterium]|nr:DUF4173 domain-containing protein [Anaerolineae bacterium]
MQRRTLAVWLVLIGLALGLIGDLFFYHKALGLSFPLFIGICILAVLAVANAAQIAVNRRNLWPLLPLLVLAAMLAVRADPLIRVLDVAAVLSLGALGLGFLARGEPLDEAGLGTQTGVVISNGFYAAFGAIPEASYSWNWLRDRSWKGRTAVSVVKGLVLALPIVLLFALLLGSADEVFAGYVEDVWNMLALRPSIGLFDQAFLTLILAWVITGSLAYGLGQHSLTTASESYLVQGDGEAELLEESEPLEDAPVVEKRKKGLGLQLGMVESSIVLGLVDLLFGAFVLVQLAYFFGGEATIEARGLSYSQYARSGFFELVTVSVLTLGLVLLLDHITLRGSQREHTIFRVLAVVIVGLTCVMLVSAAQRMYLYEEAFGFTQLRVYTHVYIVWLGILFGVFLLSLFRLKRQVFAFGVLLVTIGYLLTLNFMDVDLYIAEHNIARYEDGRALDLSFIATLSLDALPAILPLHDSLAEQPEA